MEHSALHAVNIWHGPTRMPSGIVTKKKKKKVYKWPILKQIGYYLKMYTF